MQWVEARDAADHPATFRTHFHTKNYCPQIIVSSAEIEKLVPWALGLSASWLTFRCPSFLLFSPGTLTSLHVFE